MQIHYIKHSFVALTALVSSAAVNAQSPGSHSLEIQGGLREYSGDLGSSIGFQRRPDYQGGGVNFAYYINPKIDGLAALSFGDVGFARHWEGENWQLPDYARYQSFRANTADLTLGARFKLLSEESAFQPYVQAGIGGFYCFSQVIWGPSPYVKDEYDPILTRKPAMTDINAALQGGLGFKFYFSEKIALHWNFTVTYTMSDMWDGANNAVPDPVHPPTHKLWRTNDMWSFHNIGFSYAMGGSGGGGSARVTRSRGGDVSVGKVKDEDEDGVFDKYDKCKGTLVQHRKYVDSVGCPVDSDGDGILDGDDKCIDDKGLPEFKGCPDTDGDGIEDRLDACPKVAGSAKFNGCPDTDGDGISDKEDACPTVAGLASLKGCPDTDGDGIEDGKDKCPAEAGTIATNGCPDKDGDGVADSEDKCPAVAGTKAGSGCPDTDGDGVFDHEDACPKVPGTAANKGCPKKR